MKKSVLIISLVVIVMFILGFTVKVTSYPPDDTRIILDHTKKIYIAPPCFEEADPTNYLEETTYLKAKQTDYPAQAPCTENLLAGVSEPIFISGLKKVGVMKSDWAW